MAGASSCVGIHMAALVLLMALGQTFALTHALQKVTPVEKVISLMKNLQAKLEDEGKTDAANYDKFACFCKEQSDNKLYAIEKSREKIARLTAKATELSTEISELNSAIVALGASIKGVEADIKAGQESRAKEHAEYVVAEQDASGAISALEGAIVALKGSKSDLHSAKLDLVQVSGSISSSIGTLSSLATRSAKGSAMTTALMQALQDPATYAYHGNDIIHTLESMLKTFTENKKQLDIDEFNAQAAFDTRDLDLNNQKAFQSKDKAEKEKVLESKTAELNAVMQDKTQESADMRADQTFLDVLTKDCETKANLWDQRSKMRSGELSALAEALDLLSTKVSAAYGANTKLVGLQTQAVQAAAGAEAVAALKPARSVRGSLSFLQVRSRAGQESSSIIATRKAAEMLQAASASLDSQVLATVAARLLAAQDHFVKVRSIIKDLIFKLEADKEAEATQKSFCDRAMAESLSARDTSQALIEQLHATMSSLEAEKAALTKEIADLSKAVAAAKKGLMEATELRTKESAENAETVSTATEGKTAVELALKVLTEFYSKAASGLIQTQYVPADADREGQSYADAVPDVFQGDYRGDQKSSQGIVGLLEVIVSDFARTIETVSAQELSAAADFTAFAASTEADIATKQDTVEQHRARVSACEDELVASTDKLHEQESLHSSAENTLLGLKAQCVDGEETYEERVAKRKKEIEALKQAKAILEEWQG